MKASQYQLLNILQIKPLQLHADFYKFQPFIDLPQQSAASSESSLGDLHLSAQIPLEYRVLVDDIQRALQMYLPHKIWLYSAQLQHSELIHAELRTPEPSLLLQPSYKKQLWQLLLQHTETDESSS